MDCYQVPDLIEPYYGYKWLRVNNDHLLSNHSYQYWPNDGPVVARCSIDPGHQWAPVATGNEQPKIVWNEDTDTNTSSGTIIRPGQPPQPFTGDPNRVDPDLRTRIVLPWGQSWSWEPLPRHPAPQENCSCGIYAVNTPKQCDHYGFHRAVLVRVAVWGKVIRGTDGVRGQYAYPVKIVKAAKEVDGEQVANLRHRYRLEKPVPAPPPQAAEPNNGQSDNRYATVERPKRNLRDKLGL